MTAVNHIATGALIGIVLHNPIALVLALLSHFVLDALPHFGTEISDVTLRNKNPLFRKVMLTDIILSMGILLWLGLASTLFVVLAGIIAFLPDAAWLYRGYFEHTTGVIQKRNWFNQFHKSVQWAERRWGIMVEVVWLTGAVLLLMEML